MTVEEPKKKGRVAAAILAGSALTFSSFAIGVPAAFADEIQDPSPAGSVAPPTDTGSDEQDSTSDTTPGDEPTGEAETSPAEQSENGANQVASEGADQASGEGETKNEGAGSSRSSTNSSRMAQPTDVEPMNNNGGSVRVGLSVLTTDEFMAFEEGDGVPHTVEGLEPGTSLTYEVAAPNEYIYDTGTLTVEEDGTAYFAVRAPEGSDPSDLVGEHTTTVTHQVDDENVREFYGYFTVEEPDVEIDPYLFIDPKSGPAGTIIDINAWGFTPRGNVQFSLTPIGGDDEIDLGTLVADEEGDLTGETVTIPEAADNGGYTLTALDVESGESESVNFNVTDVTLTIDPPTLDIADFREGGDGVALTIEGLEPEAEVDITVAMEYALTELGDVVTADSDGTAELVLNGPADSVYLGNYYITALDVESELQVAQGSFEVTSDKPQIFLPETEVYQGEALDVQISNLTPNGEIEVAWNPTETFTADATGLLVEELPIDEDAETGVQTLTVTDVESEESNSVEYTVLEADVVEPALTIDPEEITLEDFVGDPDDGAGVTHVVEGLEPGAEITYTVTGPEGVNDFEQTRSVDENGVLEFVIHGFEGPNPEVYLGDYTTVVSYENEDGETEELTGSFSVVTGDDDEAGTDEDDDAAEPVADTSADINGTDLAETGATSGQLALIAGGLLLLGGAFVVFANRARLFGRKH